MGVSANSKRVFGRIAACQAATSVCETKLVSTPRRAISVPSSLMVEPNMDCEQTTWSPALRTVSATSRMADMPVLVATAHSVPSMAARRRSKLVTVGLAVRL